MAIIGPRPLLVRYLARYNEEQHHRHDVRPGLGHVFWSEEFSKRFLSILETEYEWPETADKLWEDIYIDHISELDMKIRKYGIGICLQKHLSMQKYKYTIPF